MNAIKKSLAYLRQGHGKLWHLGRAALAIVLLLLVWAIVVLAMEFLKTAEIVQKKNWENPQWTVNHTEIEFLEFLWQLSEAKNDESADLDSLRLAFDIFYSRVATLQDANIAEELRSYPSFAAELGDITGFVDDAVKIVDAPDPELRAALPNLASQAVEFRENLHRLKMISLEHWAAESSNRRNASARTLLWLSFALAATFALLSALVAGLWLNYRANLRRQKAIAEAHNLTRLAEATLRQNEARLREAQKIAKLGAWEVNSEGQLYWSDEAFHIFGMTKSEFDGTVSSFFKRCHPDDIPRIRSAAREAWDTHSKYEVTHRIELPSGETRTLTERAEPVLDDSGKTICLVGTVQDITEQTVAEEKLRQAQKMEVVGQLTGGVAHDFNNLLAVILGNLELLQEKVEPENEDTFIQAAITAAERGAELTKNMLSFARQSRLEPKITDLNKLVRETKSWTSRVLPESIEVEVSLLAGLWQVEVDQSLAQSALLNLLLNARDAMPDGGKLTIETANIRIDEAYVELNSEEVEPGRYVMLAVSDTGTGIAPAQLARIFEPFYTTKPTGSGSGLGLSMVQGFMRQSGGTVRVYSELGTGTTFKLYFKACSGEESPPKILPTSREMTSRPDARILLVEDEPAVIDVLANHLSRAGYSVTQANSGDAALEIWEAAEADFDLLITDIVMPGSLQGTHLAKELRARCSDLPVVFLSGYANEAMVHGNGLRPEDLRLMKPVRRADFISAVDKALDKASKGSKI